MGSSSSALHELKKEWFARLERLNTRCHQFPPTGLKCLDICSALCCPQVQMRSMSWEQVASHVVVLLPFEMEYLIEKVGASLDSFRLWPVKMAPGVVIDVGMFDLGRLCPFLQPNSLCGIYGDRPVDCQTFPLLPVLNQSGQLDWTYGQNCPSLPTLSPLSDQAVWAVWVELYAVLPKSWWALYDAADDWRGWPPQEEDGDG
jgi:hypothetical protein